MAPLDLARLRALPRKRPQKVTMAVTKKEAAEGEAMTHVAHTKGEHMAKKAKKQDIRIVILQRGWVVVGRYSQDGDECQLEGAKVIRRWGTTKGLGELAAEGPIQGKTVLDPAPLIRFHALTVVASIACEASKWAALVQ